MDKLSEGCDLLNVEFVLVLVIVIDEPTKDDYDYEHRYAEHEHDSFLPHYLKQLSDYAQ